MIQRAAAGDCEQPGDHGATRVEAVQIVVGFDEGLLREVLGILRMPSHLLNVIVDAAAVQADNSGECMRVSRERRADELGLGRGFEAHGDELARGRGVVQDPGDEVQRELGQAGVLLPGEQRLPAHGVNVRQGVGGRNRLSLVGELAKQG